MIIKQGVFIYYKIMSMGKIGDSRVIIQKK